MKSLFKPLSQKNTKGQVLVEYLLLMVITIGFATILTKQLVSRKSGSDTGMIIQAWDRIIKNIASDIPDCANPNCRQ